MDFQGALTPLNEFLDRGGPVLLLIMALTFVMWAFILERLAYFFIAQGGDAKRALKEWSSRSDHTSWTAHAIRDQLISEARQKAENNVELVKTLVAVSTSGVVAPWCPYLRGSPCWFPSAEGTSFARPSCHGLARLASWRSLYCRGNIVRRTRVWRTLCAVALGGRLWSDWRNRCWLIFTWRTSNA